MGGAVAISLLCFSSSEVKEQLHQKVFSREGKNTLFECNTSREPFSNVVGEGGDFSRNRGMTFPCFCSVAGRECPRYVFEVGCREWSRSECRSVS